MRFAQILIAVFVLCPLAFAEDSATRTPSPITLELSPSALYPLAPNGEVFSAGIGASLSLEYAVPPVAGLSVLGGLGYSDALYAVAGSGSVSILAADAGAALRLALSPSLGARLFARGGLAWGYENGSDGATQGLSNGTALGTAEAGAGLDWSFATDLSLRLGLSYRAYTNLYGGAGLSLGLAWSPPARAAQAPVRELRLLELEGLSLKSLYPVFHAWYDENSVGTVRVRNVGKATATDIKVEFLIRQFMDAPKACAYIPELKPGESKELPLYALLNSSILDVTEATKATSEVLVDYRSGDASGSRSATASITVYDRNALTWDDDRKAAAFVSGKDPWVLVLSNHITNAVAKRRNPGVDSALQTAMAVHEALRLYGLTYVVNPKNPFAAAKANPEIVDFLKFPRQTLAYKAGDCSDLSILYSSLFESVGIETAFVTIPGHIFMAVALPTSPEMAARLLSGSEDLIVEAGKAWLPIETTMRNADFLAAWAEGAREWKACSLNGTTAFYPIHEAWKTYQPVGLSADSTSPEVPDPAKVAGAFALELSAYVEREVAYRVASIDATMKQKGKTPKALNDRGVVYASLGRLDLAEADFKAASAKGDYFPSVVNLGNVALMKNDNKSAYAMFAKAAKSVPDNARLQASLAKSAAALGKTAESKAALDKLRGLDSGLATQLASAIQTGTTGTRAAEAGSEGGLTWEQE